MEITYKMASTIPEKYLLYHAKLMSVVNKKGSPRITRTPLTQCWTHTTSNNTAGYGQVMIKKIQWNIHRLSWFLHNGCPENEDHPFYNSHKYYITHLCDNKECCNPEHLELQEFKKILTKDKVLEIRTRQQKGLKYGELKQMAEEYGIAYPTIQAIVAGRLWNKPEYFPL